MREKYPLDQTLDRLQRLLRAWYINLKDAERQGEREANGQDTGRESWHDAEETIPDSISESQPTMRPPENIRCDTSVRIFNSAFLTLKPGIVPYSREKSQYKISNH
jgi:hypothetical protein